MAITPPGAGTFTALHLVVLGVLILATLALIAAGVRRSRARRAARERVEEEAAQAGVPEPPAAPPPAAPLPDRAAVVPPILPANDDFVRPRPVASEPERAEPTSTPLEAAPLADEPIAAAAPMDASPATVADPIPADASASPSPADGPVTQLKGLGPKVAARLAELGLSTVGQIAALDADQAASVDARLGPFAGRLHRDRWVEQARFLAAGDTKGFEAVFGRL
jgi:predicted flap endonuclease-1-like 5' DNA nuclease